MYQFGDHFSGCEILTAQKERINTPKTLAQLPGRDRGPSFHLRIKVHGADPSGATQRLSLELSEIPNKTKTDSPLLNKTLCTR